MPARSTAAAGQVPDELAAWQVCDGPDEVARRLAARAGRPAMSASASTASGDQEAAQVDALIEAHKRTHWAAAWPRLIDALRRDASPRAQAAAWIAAGWPVEVLLIGKPWAWADGALGPQPRDAMQGLVRLALSSRDPVVLAWTLALCRRPQQAHQCDGLSARQWTHASPQEGLAWLALLAEEPQAQDEALAGLARIERVAPLMGQLQAVLDRALPDDVPRYLRLGLSTASVDWEGAHVMHNALAPVAGPCHPARMTDANRRQACGVVVERLERLAADELLLRLASRMGERAGWTAERVAGLRAQAEAISKAKLEALFSAGGAVRSCRNIDTLRGQWRRVGEIGERAWALERLKPAR